MTDEQEFNQNRDDLVRKLTSDVPVKKHNYTTRLGVALELRPISSLTLRQLQRDQTGKPQPPKVESVVGPKKQKIVAPNPDDPDYKTALAEWQEDRNIRYMAYVLARGVCAEPDEESVERLLEAAPGLTKTSLKYLWVLEQVEDDVEIGEIVGLIVGQTIPTPKGISDAEDRFRSDDQRESAEGIPAAEVASVDHAYAGARGTASENGSRSELD